MRQAIKELPHTLVLHLKRFEWDFETETRFKKKDRFDFPLQLDMFRYTVEGLAEAEAASSPSVRGRYLRNCDLTVSVPVQSLL